ncbi:LOW QUALITY PROTEIN: hypothetical protein CVT26_012391 [Gymnopilus dilepis]|uniref:DNA 3'-5' helicase n=1 Tax=Gymnopilus dilepis TaxID=231916 RepID=A0A409YQF7_9AGAR|nr:LOW QUALITY PROTEIN: hypothetical protein CVT26_012391 [Gymnopilus dilepis]
MVHMSPEMALAESFHKLWKDSRFRSRLTAVVVDETHCIDKLGKGGGLTISARFIRKSSTLRSYTCPHRNLYCRATFDLIWNTLAYGHQPFWGVDVGTDPPNLFYITRPYSDPKIPFLDILSILPTVLNDNTTSSDIPKIILYFDSEAMCREAVQFIRKLLPPHLVKRAARDKFQDDIYRMLCATDAAGMGLQHPQMSNMSCLSGSKSLSTVSQHWGRCGRDRTTEVVCFLLLPKWAFRPTPAESIVHQHLERSRKSKKAEMTKKDTLQRANLDVKLENFINIGFPDLPDCAHAFLRDGFSPTTGLTVCHTLNSVSGKPGFRSKKSSFEMTWVVLDLQRKPRAGRCCYRCNPEIAAFFPTISKHDRRLTVYSHHSVNGPLPPVSRPSSAASSISASSSFAVPRRGVKVPKEEEEKLRERLCKWREERHRQRGSPLFLSSQTILPPKQLNGFLASCSKFLAESNLTTIFLRKFVSWDAASESDWEDICLSSLTGTAAVVVPTTPPSQRRGRKKMREGRPAQRPVIEQPAFVTTTPRPPQPPQQSFTSRFRVSTHRQPFCDANGFQTPAPLPPPRPSMSSSHPRVSHLPIGSSPMASTSTSNAHPYPSTPVTPQNLHSPLIPAQMQFNPYHHLLTSNNLHSPLIPAQMQFNPYHHLLTSNVAYSPFLWTPGHALPYTYNPYNASHNPSNPTM